MPSLALKNSVPFTLIKFDGFDEGGMLLGTVPGPVEAAWTGSGGRTMPRTSTTTARASRLPAGRDPPNGRPFT